MNNEPLNWLNARCPRCGEAFHCGVADGAPCACAAIPLDAALGASLRETYKGCLCCACLRTLTAPASEAPPAA